jgi:hypothetical protein
MSRQTRTYNGTTNFNIQLCNDKKFKLLSLEDNVYFTLRDIFLNISGIDYVMEANELNYALTDGICYEDRTSDFHYTNVLNDKKYVDRLIRWLNNIDPIYFVCDESDESDKDFELLEHFDDWWSHFEELKKSITRRAEELS